MDPKRINEYENNGSGGTGKPDVFFSATKEIFPQPFKMRLTYANKMKWFMLSILYTLYVYDKEMVESLSDEIIKTVFFLRKTLFKSA